MIASNPRVSIVIPAYNAAKYLRQAIDSALAQTCAEVEVIVVNDGSNDGGATREVAASFGNRIRYFEKDNGGVATALNRGIREMRGAFFSWLSHDDVYYPEKIARQLACLEALGDGRAIVFSNYHVIDDASRVTGTGAIPDFALGNSILSVIGTYIGGCSMLIPRAAFEEAGLFNESLRNSQDNELWLRMVMKGYRMHYMPDILIQSRRHAEQGSLTDGARHARESRAFYLWALSFIGGPQRVANGAGLFRVLLLKRLPSHAARLFSLLRRDRSLPFAVSACLDGAWGMSRAAMVKRLSAVPLLRQLVAAVRKRRFRSSSHYWEQRYRQGETSGVGSYGRYAEYKAEVLNRFVAEHEIHRVAEFGCGDGNQLKKFKFPEYLGVDISPAAVAMCQRMYGDDATKRFVALDEPTAIEAVRKFQPDLTISLDVIYHLVEDRVFAEHIANLFDLSSRYVIVYSTNFDRRYDFCHQVDRKFTDYVGRNVRGWRLLETLANPYKGPETQSDFYIYEKVESATVAAR